MPIELIKALVQDGFGFACVNEYGSAHAVFVTGSDATIWCDANGSTYSVLDLEKVLAQRAGD